jgi:CHAD domain-containing protein
MLQGSETDRIKSQLKWLTAQLAPGRDTDVFVRKTVAPYLERHPDRREFAVLAHELEKERSAGFAKAQAAVEGGRFRRLLLDCALWLIDDEWRKDNDDLNRSLRDRPAKVFAEEELARRTRKIVKRVRKLEKLDAKRRHKLRIAVKKVRYAREFFTSLNRDRRNRPRQRGVAQRVRDRLSHRSGGGPRRRRSD